MSDDILHLVLARSSDDGLKGLSLFLCPKQPDAKVTRVEDKLGLHASPTCQMAFENAQAELVGSPGDGLKAMFTLMNHARLDVALQGVAHASRAAQIAGQYARERRQGRAADGAPLHLIDHADVRRMRDRQQVLAIGARAMCHLTLVEMELGEKPGLADFLTPICKVFGSEAGIEAADLGIQILGGYGYLDEYGMHQIWRDARICAIYEGANGIHTRSLITRGLRPNGGADAFGAFVAKLGKGHAAVQNALSDWRSLRGEVTDLDDPTPHAHEFYQSTANLFLKAVWAKIADVAEHHPDNARLHTLSQIVLT